MTVLPHVLVRYEREVTAELARELAFWRDHALDKAHGGFIARMTHQGRVDTDADKGSVLNARILWSFARAYRHTGQTWQRALADRALAYLTGHFIDPVHGGVFWSVDPRGQPARTEKHSYACAFAIYGLAEHHASTGEPASLAAATQLFHWLEEHAREPRHGGYREAVTRAGMPVASASLGDGDRSAAKSTNTQLHVLEAYAGLYRMWPSSQLRERLTALVNLFCQRIVGPDGHLRLFFDDAWHCAEPRLASYGHDIEASWLLVDAAEALADPSVLSRAKKTARALADACASVMLPDGSLHYQVDAARGEIDRHREWWVSAEAMVGFLHAYQLGGRSEQLQHSLDAWRFAQRYLLDDVRGGWNWGVDDALRIVESEDRIGPWKCPYHTVRTLIEVANRCRALYDSLHDTTSTP